MAGATSIRSARLVGEIRSGYLERGLEASKDILLKGTIAFAFLSAGISAFFPKFGSDPKSPCDGIEGEDWGKCVWQQIFPLVEEFVDAKFDDFTAKLWDAHLRGWQNRLWYIETTVKENTGSQKYVPEKVSKKMYQDLDSLHQGLIQAAPAFMMPFNKGSIAGLYMSQFSALHVNVMTTLLADEQHQTEGFRVTTQEILLCYARLVVKRTLEAREERLKAFEVDNSCGKSTCCLSVPGQKCQFACPNICRKYEDTWQHCDWSPGKCEISDSRKCVKGTVLPFGCEDTKKDTCSSSSEGIKWDCHVDHVNDQLDTMWSMWLAPVPHWLDLVVQMDALNIKKTTEAQSGFYCPL
ncbi:unnamed protein product [Symbiodinium sp. CCMP2592]|nr:unnamed protein product [Symbiodinium sp. CCMP2592]